ncbi:helix-turn-helix domain-containing protein [Endozoicomonas sp.]|uniref:helix-turn-helix domain-containing protein n=1 Tax=Endozoicomonas sp. TaxID=1892382 RepID=UPI003AF88535
MPDLAAFVTVVECESFTAAGKKLGVTPSAVSRQISRLESALSIKLLGNYSAPFI